MRYVIYYHKIFGGWSVLSEASWERLNGYTPNYVREEKTQEYLEVAKERARALNNLGIKPKE